MDSKLLGGLIPGLHNYLNSISPKATFYFDITYLMNDIIMKDIGLDSTVIAAPNSRQPQNFPRICPEMTRTIVMEESNVDPMTKRASMIRI